MSDCTIRHATVNDLPAITHIYNQAVLTTTATFDTEPETLEDRRAWFEAHDAGHPVVVAEHSGAIVGWASLSKYSERLAWGITAEIAVYVEESHRGMKFGRMLAEAIVEAGRQAGLHTLVSRIAEENISSIKLTESLGFSRVGVLKEAGRKFGRLIGVVYMQFIYD